MQEPLSSPPRGPRHGVAQSGQTPMVLPGSKSPAKVQWGFPRNLGGPVVSVEHTSARAGRISTSPGPQARAFAGPAGANWRTHRRYRRAKETKLGGTNGGKSQRP